VKALVTGGGGFIGRRVVELLLGRGDAVRILARGRYPDVEALGAEGLPGDVRNPECVDRAVAGVDVVFHVAGKAGYWGDRREYWSINVEGTRNVLRAARRAGVAKFVFTSTPSVAGYDTDVEKGAPGLPRAARHRSVYPETKAVAEALVLESNGDGFATVALRPHLVFGPGDHQLLPRVLAKAVGGSLPIVGDGRNRVDFTYVDNAAWAHLDAADALVDPAAACAGRAYFVSNGEPVGLEAFLAELLRRAGLPPIRRRVSPSIARAAAAVCEWLWTLLPLTGDPPLTRFLVDALAHSHWYDMEPTRRELGYRIRVPLTEGIERTLAWLCQKLPGAAPPHPDPLPEGPVGAETISPPSSSQGGLG